MPSSSCLCLVVVVWECGKLAGPLARRLELSWLTGFWERSVATDTLSSQGFGYTSSLTPALSSLGSPLHPPAAVWSPHGLWGDVGRRAETGSLCVSRECSGNWQDWLRVFGCPCRVGGVWGPGPECENVSESVCLSPVWLGCGCLLLVWILPPALVLIPLLPPTPARTACLLFLSPRNWSLPCLFLEFGEEEEEEAGRQTSHTLARPPAWHHGEMK